MMKDKHIYQKNCNKNLLEPENYKPFGNSCERFNKEDYHDENLDLIDYNIIGIIHKYDVNDTIRNLKLNLINLNIFLIYFY